jgi:uncharacterized RDD family membrane protein YckC
MEQKYTYGSFWRRLSANIIDNIFLLIPFYGLLASSVTFQDFGVKEIFFIPLLAAPVWLILFSLWNNFFMVYSHGASLGKQFLGLSILHKDGGKASKRQLFLRFGLNFLLGQILWITIPFRKDKKSLTDLAADTVVQGLNEKKFSVRSAIINTAILLFYIGGIVLFTAFSWLQTVSTSNLINVREVTKQQEVSNQNNYTSLLSEGSDTQKAVSISPSPKEVTQKAVESELQKAVSAQNESLSRLAQTEAQLISSGYSLPELINDYTSLNEVVSKGNQVIFKFATKAEQKNFPMKENKDFSAKGFCGDPYSLENMKRGIVYVQQFFFVTSETMDSFVISKADCGL